MGFIAFVLVFFIGFLFSLFIKKKISILVIFLVFLSIIYYFIGPKSSAEFLDNKALVINGTIDSNFYKSINTIQEAYKGINSVHSKILKKNLKSFEKNHKRRYYVSKSNE